MVTVLRTLDNVNPLVALVAALTRFQSSSIQNETICEVKGPYKEDDNFKYKPKNPKLVVGETRKQADIYISENVKM